DVSRARAVTSGSSAVRADVGAPCVDLGVPRSTCPCWHDDDVEGTAMRLKVVAACAAVAAVVGVVLVPPGGAGAVGEVVRPVRACADLTGDFGFPGAGTHVTKAEVVGANAATATPEYCDVRGFVEPAVRFELKLPTQTYSGRYVQYGCD